MREILFRGKRVDTGEWCYGVPLLEGWSEKTYIASYEYSSLAFVQQIEIIPKTLGQFTGLTDKNGKRIFEGDIIAHWDDYDEIITNRRSVVRYGFLNCGCCHSVYGFSTCDKNGNVNENANLHGDGVCAESACVIGNIIDNPELM